MFSNKFLFCYYPTTTILLDDNEEFIESVNTNFDKDISINSFLNPKNALQYILNENHPHLSTNIVLTNIDQFEIISENELKHPIDIDLAAIHREIYNPDRFKQITSIIVDYNMPETNGVEFCRLLKDNPVTKIMLTGEADQQIAIDAFNEGIIDKFITKDTLNLSKVLRETLKWAQYIYFQRFSNKIISMIENKHDSPYNKIEYIDFVHDLLSTIGFTEYYVFDKSGSILYLDEFARVRLVVVRSVNEMNEYFKLAEDNGAPSDIIKSLYMKEKILFFPSDNDFKMPVMKWKNHMHKAIPMSHKVGFYYSIIDCNSKIIDIDKVLSFQAYVQDKY